ncbi:3'(2'),5'-bisphosphate nucleotidase [Batrachochytrium salamandrivorans]|nr:3'(2'),5'-bisphosphate nucleotidase [Batrachochytrium salamandrivorans]
MSLELQQVCINAVRAGCRVASLAQKDWLGRSVTKQDQSPVTVADFAVQAVVSFHLFRSLPSAKLVAEETRETFLSLSPQQLEECLARVQSEVPELDSVDKIAAVIARGGFENLPSQREACFILDPIDGTKGFIRGEQYAICLGQLSAEGEPTVGVIGCPNLCGESTNEIGFLFEAQVGLGGTRIRTLRDNHVLMEITHPMSDKVVFAESYESSHTVQDVHSKLHRAFGIGDKAVIRVDSQVKYALLVRGDCTVYPRCTGYDQCIWDVLPGAVILQQAGGKLTDEWGFKLNFKTGRVVQRHTLLATSSLDAELHNRVLRTINE